MKLNYASLKSDKILTARFSTYDSLFKKLDRIIEDFGYGGKVYLMFVMGQIYVTDTAPYLIYWGESLTSASSDLFHGEERNVNVHEFESFEDAYRTALDLLEENPLCYEKEEKFKVNVKFTTPN